MEFIENYGGFEILRDKETGFFRIKNGADFSSLILLKSIIDKKNNSA